MNLENPKFITVHGIDGTGRTTTTELICKKLNERNISSINYDNSEIRKQNPHKKEKERIDKEGTLEDLLVANMLSTSYHSNEIIKLLEEGYTNPVAI